MDVSLWVYVRVWVGVSVYVCVGLGMCVCVDGVCGGTGSVRHTSLQVLSPRQVLGFRLDFGKMHITPGESVVGSPVWLCV